MFNTSFSEKLFNDIQMECLFIISYTYPRKKKKRVRNFIRKSGYKF
jgi:hypothetical protein